MKDEYTIKELSNIVNRLSRRTPKIGEVATVPDIINFQISGTLSKVYIPLPAGSIDKVRIYLELGDVEGPQDDIDRYLIIESSDISYRVKMNPKLGIFDKQIVVTDGVLTCSLEGPDIITASVTLQFSPTPHENSMKQVLLED